MAEGTGGGGGGGGGNSNGSNRDASRPRPRVQQLRPTNKDAVAPTSPAPNVPAAVQSAVETEKSSTTATATAQAPAQPRVIIPRIVTGQGSGSTILVNSCQRGNPILQHIKNIGWEYGDIVPDYQVGSASCVLFLSLRYHRLHPEYIHSRIQKMGHMYTLRIMLVMCDVDDSQSAIKELVKVALVNSLTLMVAWTAEEAGSYIERYKAFEHKAPDLIRERVNNDYMSHLNSALTSIKGVNKTDVMTLATNFGSFKRIAEASSEELSQCPGFGATKVKRVRDVFSQPFRVGETRSGRERRAERQRLVDNGAPPLPSSGASVGRFIDDDEEEELLRQQHDDDEAIAQPPKHPSVTESSSYVKPKTSGVASNAIADPDEEEEIENADDWDLEGMTEEEATLLALEMSRSG